MLAVCFQCGKKKSGPMRMCPKCDAVPNSDQDKILSLCLSLECITERSLSNCRAYFKQKKKPPRFKPAVVQRATALFHEQIEHASVNQSVEFSSSVFDFGERNLIDDSFEMNRETITVHVIGKGPNQHDQDANASFGSSGKTFHQTVWVVGKEISEQHYLENKNQVGDIHIWYRWLNNQWSWQFVSESKFNQLKSVESGRVS